MATTWSIPRGSTRSWAARRRTRGSARRSARAGSGRCSTSCPTTWRSPSGATPGGGTCWRTARPAATPATSTSTGIRPSPAAQHGAAAHPGRPLRPGAGGRRAAAGRAGTGRFEIHYHEHRMPVAPRSLDTLLAEAARRCGSPDLAFIADAFGAAPARHRHRPREHRPPAPRQGGARRPARPPLRGAARGGRGRGRGGGGDQRRSRPRSTSCSSARTTGSPSGAPPARSSTTGASSTSTPWSACAWRTSGCSPTPTPWCSRWLDDGVLDGLRIDHPGRPARPRGVPRAAARRRPRRPGSWWRRSWSRASRCRETGRWRARPATTSSNRVGGLFVDPAGEEPLTGLYARADGRERRLAGAGAARRSCWSCGELLASDVNRLAEVFLEVCERHRRHRDYTRFELREALREVVACFPVYRTYVRAEAGEVSERRPALRRARRSRPPRPTARTSPPTCSTSSATSCCCEIRAASAESELVMRFQQLTGPAMAKGVEDTAFYNFHRLVSLNEVGGEPGRFGVSRRGVPPPHARRPSGAGRAAMLATSTHDTKRSEDVRARISLLSEIPERWGDAVAPLDRAQRAASAAADLPDRNTEYLLYQTLVGAWPISAERAVGLHGEGGPRGQGPHLLDATRTREYEEALRAFVDGVLGDPEFVADLEAFVAPAGRAGADQLPRPDAAQAHRSRRARLLPGHGALGPLPGRSRQPPAGRLRPAAPPARGPEKGMTPGGDPGPHGRGAAEALGDPPGAPTAPPPAASLFGPQGDYEPLAARGPGRSTRWLSSAGRCHGGGAPGCSSGSAGDWGGHRSGAPPARGATS